MPPGCPGIPAPEFGLVGCCWIDCAFCAKAGVVRTNGRTVRMARARIHTPGCDAYLSNSVRRSTFPSEKLWPRLSLFWLGGFRLVQGLNVPEDVQLRESPNFRRAADQRHPLTATGAWWGIGWVRIHIVLTGQYRHVPIIVSQSPWSQSSDVRREWEGRRYSRRSCRGQRAGSCRGSACCQLQV